MRKNLLNLLRLVPIALLLCAGIASAQSTGVITGVVTDGSTSKPVVGAVVVATSPALQGEKTAVTGSDGSFTISGLPAGSYRLAAQLGSYKPAERSDLAVKADTTLRANLSVVPEAVQMEEVVVTGSRVRRLDLTASAPVLVVNREQLVDSGKDSVGAFLQTIPQQQNGINNQINNGGDGTFKVDLRGLGTQRTLVLLNGRRMVAGGTGADSTVDLNSVPFAAIDRVEVLADGASAQYGSDAIAGVVNLITRKGYAGTAGTAQYGVSSHGDGQSWDLNINSGVAGDTGSVFFNVGYFWQQAIFMGQRDWSTNALSYDYTTGEATPLGSGTIPNGRFRLPTAAPAPGESAFVASLRSTFPGQRTFIWQPAGTAGTVCTTVAGQQSCWRPYVASGAVNDTYNFAPVNYLVTPAQRISLFTAGDQKLGTDTYSPRFYWDGLYTNRSADTLIAPVPVPLTNFGVTIAANNPYNPTGIEIIDARKRFVEAGGRAQTYVNDTFRFAIGMDGKIPLPTWIWDTSLTFGRTDAVTTQEGSLVVSKMANATGPGFGTPGNYQCGTPANPIAGCLPLNFFGGPAGNDASTVNAIAFNGTDRGYNQILDWQVNFSGEIFKIPTANRSSSLAIGNELMKQWGAFIPNPIAGTNDSTDGNSLATKGDFYTNQTYAELLVPVASDIFLLNDLELSLAARYSWYNTFGSNFSWMTGGRYRPIRDVTLRGTYSTGFRAPSIGELYGGTAESFPSVQDPCAGPFVPPAVAPPNCGAAAGNGDTSTQLKEIVGGNANLKPETSKSWTVGFVFEPTFVKNLTFTFDYWSFEVNNSIATVGAPVILNGCYSAAGTYCNQIFRDPTTQYITLINDTLVNVGSDSTAGIDMAFKYTLPTDIGRWDFGALATWTSYFKRTFADGSVINGVGNYDLAAGNSTGGMYPEWKGNASVGWTWNDLFAGLRWRFVGGFKECGNTDGTSDGGQCFGNPSANIYQRSVAFYHVTDLFVSYNLKTSIGKTNFGFGINNLFDAKPSVIYSAFAASADPSLYDWVGQYFYFRIGQSI